MRVGGVGAAAGLEDELVHAGQLAQDPVEAVHDREHALQRVLGLQRVELGELRRAELLVDARVVLHRAGAEEADAHHPQRLLRQAQVVAQHLGLGELGQLRRVGAPHRFGHERLGGPDGGRDLRLDRGEEHATPARRAHLHDERLVPAGRVECATRLAAHEVTSSSASASRSMSGRLWTSVTQ